MAYLVYNADEKAWLDKNDMWSRSIYDAQEFASKEAALDAVEADDEVFVLMMCV